MIIERQLENIFIGQLSALSVLQDAQIVGSRTIAPQGETKSEQDEKSTIVAVACGFRQNDAFSLSPITMPISISILTRTELDPTSEKHDMVVEAIADKISYWHKYSEAMGETFTTDKFLAGELRMDGGTARVYDATNSTWQETISLSIRGAEKFIREEDTLYKYEGDTTWRTVSISGEIKGSGDGETPTTQIPNVRDVVELKIGTDASIGEYAFSGCSELKNITIPNNATSIGDWAFLACEGLSSITIPNSVTSIGGGAFSGSGIVNMTIPDSVTSIGGLAFSDCDNISTVTIVANSGNAYNVKDMMIAAGCPSNITWIMPEIVETLYKYVGETNWRSINIRGLIDQEQIPNAWDIEQLNIGVGVTSVVDGAFMGNPNLKNLTIPNSVTSIGDYAFQVCSSLANVTIGNGIASIGDSAFEMCDNLQHLTFKGKTLEQVQSMANYPWGITNTSIIDVEN